MNTIENIDKAVFNADGLIPAIIQQWDTSEVLMLGWMDAEALRRTATTGRVTFWSRSRQEYWRKGDTSGHAQFVRSAAFDCDADTLLVKVDQVGVACHTGTRTCFDGRGFDVVVGDAGAVETSGTVENSDTIKNAGAQP
jgi:phosphoribosyl-AMP cyclohydrolase